MRPRSGDTPALTRWEQTSRLLVLLTAPGKEYTPDQWRLVWRCHDALYAADTERIWIGIPSIFS